MRDIKDNNRKNKKNCNDKENEIIERKKRQNEERNK